MQSPAFSIVIPVYNRPQELRELLESLATQTQRDFEVIVVDDGSQARSDAVVDQFRDQIRIEYLYKPNSGPGPSRNAGFALAKGNYFVVFDSDCILPPSYFRAVTDSLAQNPLDAWGGPDKGHEKFTLVQRATAYTMSSVLTTGGIRGGKARLGWFQPRSFNMGLSRKVFEATGGFQFDRLAEDIELSIRIRQKGFRVGLIPEAYVYHKRRSGFGQFFNQVFNFGKGRALVGKRHPKEVKLTHWIPALFTLGIAIMPVIAIVNQTLFFTVAVLYGAYFLAVVIHSLAVTRHLGVAVLSIPAALLQLVGYGTGFLAARFSRGRS